MNATIRNATLLTANGPRADATIHIHGGRIAEGPSGPANEWDARGLYLLPGIVDLHGDAFERQVMPRPGVRFGLDVALLDTDRQMIANGITTTFHGLTYSWEPGLRGREAALDFLEGLQAVKPRLACDTRLHLRFELYNTPALSDVLAWMDAGRVDMLGFNEHLELISRKIDNPDKLTTYMSRTGLSAEGLRNLLTEVRGRGEDVPGVTTALAAKAAELGLPLCSHDDETPAMRRHFHDLGCSISEFPVNRETAAEAVALGDHIILGAPNALRGKSHDARLGAREAVQLGLCDILSSDYYYPSLLQAPFVLARQGLATLHHAWELVSANPAKAAGLTDRGRIAPGMRADLLLVEAPENAAPIVRAVFVEGRPVYTAGLIPSAVAPTRAERAA